MESTPRGLYFFTYFFFGREACKQAKPCVGGNAWSFTSSLRILDCFCHERLITRGVRCFGRFDVLGTAFEQCMRIGRFISDGCFMMPLSRSDTTAIQSPIMSSTLLPAFRTLGDEPPAYTVISPMPYRPKTGDKTPLRAPNRHPLSRLIRCSRITTPKQSSNKEHC